MFTDRVASLTPDVLSYRPMHIYHHSFPLPVSPVLLRVSSSSLSKGILPFVSLISISTRRSVFPISQLSELTFPSITGRFIPRVPLLSVRPIYVPPRCLGLSLCLHVALSVCLGVLTRFLNSTELCFSVLNCSTCSHESMHTDKTKIYSHE